MYLTGKLGQVTECLSSTTRDSVYVTCFLFPLPGSRDLLVARENQHSSSGMWPHNPGLLLVPLPVCFYLGELAGTSDAYQTEGSKRISSVVEMGESTPLPWQEL